MGGNGKGVEKLHEMKGVTIFVIIATILAVIGLGYTFMASKAQSEANETIGIEIEDLNSDLSSLQNHLNTLNSSLTQLTHDLENLDAEMQSEIVSIQGDISSLENEMLSVQTGITNMQSDVVSLMTQISDIQNELSDIQVDITNLQSSVASLSTQISNIQSDLSTVQASVTDLQGAVLLLQSEVSDLGGRVTALETERAIVIRINFLTVTPDAVPPGGEDYLFDAEAVGTNIYAQDRTGHSRFIEPRYLDLVIENGTQFIGDQVTINIYAYWHLDDMVIDIDPDPAHGRTIGTDPNGGYLTLTYTIGTVLQGSVDGNDDGYILDLYDAYFDYKVETLI